MAPARTFSTDIDFNSTATIEEKCLEVFPSDLHQRFDLAPQCTRRLNAFDSFSSEMLDRYRS
jgi:hypothetical protein